MSVHIAITKHAQKQNTIIREFIYLDQKREEYIEEVISQCKNGETFTTEKINQVTLKINELAKSGKTPQRKYVTIDMVQEYVNK
ncbi:YpbS family protein [Bacillus sp. 03113]|uniref:YpbS family protein n=1 Tax=Bacillus sp. 03113 TaxID=2578211 RepID=UPI0011448A3D|nr:YpbS family protein [Bacillus sp. 03113]